MIDRLVQSKFIYLFIFIFYIIGLWGMSIPLTGDQKVYLSVALEMKERGEWIIPYLFGEPNFLKPPFQYWATLMGWNVFGLSLFGALIPSVLALLGSAYFVNRIAKVEMGSKSFLPGLLFSASLGTMTYGTTAQMEIWIVFFYLWSWFELLQNRMLRAFLVVGMMSWVKGPLYPVLWVLSSWFYFYLRHDFKRVLSKSYLGSLAVGIFVGLLWYALAARTQLQAMLDVFLMRENMGKMQTSQGSPWGLWGEFLYSLLPWLPWLLITLCSKASQNRIRSARAFLLAYALIPALFFTFFPYRVNTYLYLLTPFAVWLIDDPEEMTGSFFSRMLSVFIWILAVGLSYLTFRLCSSGWMGIEVGFPLICLWVLWAIFFTKLNLKAIGVTSLLIVNLIRVGAVQIGEKDLAGLRTYQSESSAPLAYWIDRKDIWHEFGLISAAMRTDIVRLMDFTARDAFLDQGGTVIFQDTQESETHGLDCVDWHRLRRRMKFPIAQFFEKGLPFGDSSLMRTFHLCKRARQKTGA